MVSSRVRRPEYKLARRSPPHVFHLAKLTTSTHRPESLRATNDSESSYHSENNPYPSNPKVNMENNNNNNEADGFLYWDPPMEGTVTSLSEIEASAETLIDRYFEEPIATQLIDSFSKVTSLTEDVLDYVEMMRDHYSSLHRLRRLLVTLARDGGRQTPPGWHRINVENAWTVLVASSEALDEDYRCLTRAIDQFRRDVAGAAMQQSPEDRMFSLPIAELLIGRVTRHSRLAGAYEEIKEEIAETEKLVLLSRNHEAEFLAAMEAADYTL